MARDREAPLTLDPEACTHCNECLEACPRDAIELTTDDICIDASACDGCEDCALVCPTTAIQSADCEVVLRPRRRPGVEQVPFDARNVEGFQPKTPTLDSPGGVASLPKTPAPESPGVSRVADGTPWTISDVAIGLGLMLLLALTQRATQLPMRLRGLSPDATHIILTLWMVVFYIGVVAALFAIARRRGAVPEDLGVRPFNVKRALINCLVALVAVYALTMAYDLVAGNFGFQNNTRLETQMLRWFGLGPLGFFLSVLVAVIIAPIAEEAFFRGFVYTALRRRIGVVGAVVASGVIFALYHANLWLIIPVSFLGMALAWLYETQDSLGPPLLFHGLYNFLAIVAIYFLSGRV